jgi:KaiC/GvpD/RAD55 family RecA-like ATPase
MKELEKRCSEIQEDILEPFIKDGDATLIYSPSGVGKSFFSLGIAVAIASGSEFLGYKAPKPLKVMYIDGEMSKWQLKDRIDASITISNKQLVDDNLSLVNREITHGMFPDIGSESEWRLARRDIIASSVNVVVFDNFSTLALGVEDENSASSFNNTLELVLSLKQEGILPIMIHHANKTGQSYRGSTKIEAIFSNIISLERSNAIDLALGAGFRVKFTKNRNEYSEYTEPRTVQLVKDEGWRVVKTDDDFDERVLAELKSFKHTNQSQLGKALDVNQSTIARSKKRLIANKKISHSDWTNFLVAANDNLRMEDDSDSLVALGF